MVSGGPGRFRYFALTRTDECEFVGDEAGVRWSELNSTRSMERRRAKRLGVKPRHRNRTTPAQNVPLRPKVQSEP